MARQSGEALLAIINDILDLSKIEAGRLELESIPFTPRTMIDEVQSLFGELASSKGLKLYCSVADSVPPQVYGDPTRLRQVIMNLLSNALKFTPEGAVYLTLSCVAQAEHAADQAQTNHCRMQLAVRDTGIGMDTAAMAGLFKSFSQADNSTTRRFGGTGLGLAICQHLVSLMDGDISVQSTPGSGSCFTAVFTLALQPPEAVVDAYPGQPFTPGALSPPAAQVRSA